MSELIQPLPQLTPENRFFWTSGADGLLRFQRCQDCGTYLHPPLANCHGCLGTSIVPQPVSGLGTIAAYTINYHTWHPALPAPYAIGVVEIDEAPYVRLTTNVIGCELDAVRIGMRGKFEFRQVADVWLPIFRVNSDD